MPKLFEVKKAADSSSEHEEVELASHVINPPRGQYFSTKLCFSFYY